MPGGLRGKPGVAPTGVRQASLRRGPALSRRGRCPLRSPTRAVGSGRGAGAGAGGGGFSSGSGGASSGDGEELGGVEPRRSSGWERPQPSARLCAVPAQLCYPRVWGRWRQGSGGGQTRGWQAGGRRWLCSRRRCALAAVQTCPGYLHNFWRAGAQCIPVSLRDVPLGLL